MLWASLPPCPLHTSAGTSQGSSGLANREPSSFIISQPRPSPRGLAHTHQEGEEEEEQAGDRAQSGWDLWGRASSQQDSPPVARLPPQWPPHVIRHLDLLDDQQQKS